MKRMIKQLICLSVAIVIMMVNCINVMAKDNDVSYSEIMADEVKAGATENINIEAEEIFGGEKASTTIDSSSKKNDSSSKKDSNKKGVDDTPKTGMEETSIYVPIVLLLVAAVAMGIAGVNRFGRKRFKTAE